LWQFGLLATHDSVCHAVTGRRGGVSEAPYDELNLGSHVGDNPEHVVENRRRVCEALGMDFERLTFGQQVHGDGVRVVGTEEVGRGRASFEDGLPQTDGMIVRGPGIAIGVFVADCVPLLLYDPERHLAAAVHAGWRGTAAGIAAKAVRCLAEHFGTRPSDLVVGVGPAVGPCCYHVSEQVAEAIRQAVGPDAVAARRDDHWCADLAEANQRQLLAAGVSGDRIELSGICTSCNHDEFFSERKLGKPTGRFAALIALR
jgi:YfiH family protein